MIDHLISYDAVGLGQLVRNGEISSAELLEVTIERIERLNPQLNAVIHKLYDQAWDTVNNLNSRLKEGKNKGGLFSGVPFLVKDLFAEIKGAPFHEGCQAVKGYISKLDTELVRRQKASGLIIAAKTNTPELGLLPITEPALYGPTLNPWDPTLTPGGSSGGSAAAVAAGIVPMAHGNDGGGSIRIPASCCGIFGIKPTRGRNPLGPLFGDIGSGIVQEHAVTRTVRDSAALLDATSGPAAGDPYCAPAKERSFLEELDRKIGRLKIGFIKRIPDGWHEEQAIHSDCQSAVEDAGLLCEKLGHSVEEIDPKVLSHSTLMKSFGCVFSCMAGHSIAYWERELGKKISPDQLEPATWAAYQAGLRRTGKDYLVAVEDLQRFSRKVANWYAENGFNLLLTPTMSIPPTKIGAMNPSPDDPMRAVRITRAMVALTYFCNVTGQPAMSVPLFWSSANVPIGVQFAAVFGGEATLFQLAFQLEQVRPWANRRPPIYADKI